MYQIHMVNSLHRCMELNIISFRKKIYVLKLIIIMALFAALPLSSGCELRNPANRIQPHADNGIFDLTGWNFKTIGCIKLRGKWEFYWNRLLCPDDFSKNSPKSNTVQVPSLWRNMLIDGRRLPDEGCATYRLLIKTDRIPENLALNLKFFISSCKVWVDNKAVYKAGRVASTASDNEAGFNPQIVSINPAGSQFYLTIQISNFGYANGGFISDVELGSTLMLVNKKNTGAYKDMFLFGSILIMGLYYITLFILRRKELYTLYFSIICILLSLRILLMGEMLLYNFLPDIPLFIFLKISSSTLSLVLPFFALYIRSFFPKDTPLWFVRLSEVIGFSFTAITIMVPEKVNSLFLLPFQICSVFIVIIILFILAKAVLLRRDAARVFLAATGLIALIILNDILNGYGVIKTGYFIPLGLFLFIFVQSFMLSRKFIIQEEMLVRSELRMLQAQIKPHFLFNALNTIISVSRSSSEKAVELLLCLSDYLRCGFSFKNDEEFVDFETEILHVKSYLAIEMARFSNKLNVVFDIDGNIKARVPPYIIQPIVENAVRHGILPLKNGGTIKLSARLMDKMLSVTVEDDGVGMTEEKLASVLKGTDKNLGIGLINIRNRIQKIYGRKIEIRSAEKQGTFVRITIPLIKGDR
jgi:two-component system LytT family sensor kinase